MAIRAACNARAFELSMFATGSGEMKLQLATNSLARRSRTKSASRCSTGRLFLFDSHVPPTSFSSLSFHSAPEKEFSRDDPHTILQAELLLIEQNQMTFLEQLILRTYLEWPIQAGLNMESASVHIQLYFPLCEQAKELRALQFGSLKWL